MDAPRVVVADADRQALQWVAEILRALGAVVTEADSGADVLDIVTNQRRISLVISDVNLRPPSGLRVVALARLAGYLGPVILTTALPDESLRRWSAAMRDTTLLAKPFEAHELIARVRAVGGLGPPREPGAWSVRA